SRRVTAETARLVAHGVALAGGQAGTDRQPERIHRIDNGAGTPDRARRAVEGGQESVPRRVDLATPETIQLAAHNPLMLRQEIAPAAGPAAHRPPRRADQIREDAGSAHP